MSELSKNVQKRDSLWKAWNKIKSNGLQSKSYFTQVAVAEFEKDISRNINSISSLLQKGTFKFEPAVGIPQKRPGKKDRPIVSASVGNKVVQRAILDTIQSNQKFSHLYNQPTSFGGIKGMGVDKALAAAHAALINGGNYYASTDIKNFFTGIDRKKVIQIVRSIANDEKFSNLFENALTTELQNIEELRKNDKANLFPIYDIGVAQGCCLSPLVGNILLQEFDKRLNTREVKCLRYIDDFIVIGPNQSLVHIFFNKALDILEKLGLNCYRPGELKTKFAEGETGKGFFYLGCETSRAVIRPAKESRDRLKNSIEDLFAQSLESFSDIQAAVKNRTTYAGTMYFVGHKIRGWGNQYWFCNDKNLMANLNRELQASFCAYEIEFRKRLAKLKEKDKPIMSGMFSLEHCKNDPIIR